MFLNTSRLIYSLTEAAKTAVEKHLQRKEPTSSVNQIHVFFFTSIWKVTVSDNTSRSEQQLSKENQEAECAQLNWNNIEYTDLPHCDHTRQSSAL